MSSQTTSQNRRLAANRANAQKSTGPKTTAGKIKPSLNAVKIGLTGRTILLAHEEATEYRAHAERFRRELNPWANSKRIWCKAWPIRNGA